MFLLTTSNGVYTIDKDYKISKLLDEIQLLETKYIIFRVWFLEYNIPLMVVKSAEWKGSLE